MNTYLKCGGKNFKDLNDAEFFVKTKGDLNITVEELIFDENGDLEELVASSANENFNGNYYISGHIAFKLSKKF